MADAAERENRAHLSGEWTRRPGDVRRRPGGADQQSGQGVRGGRRPAPAHDLGGSGGVQCAVRQLQCPVLWGAVKNRREVLQILQ